MKASHLVIILYVLFVGFYASAGEECERMLKLAQAQLQTNEGLITLVDEEISLAETDVVAIEDQTTVLTEEDELDLLLTITLPVGYAENEAAFQAARHRARTVLFPLLDKIKKRLDAMDAGLTFVERLNRMARLWDEPTTPKDERTAILAQMLKMFSIPVEHHYINLITNPSLSDDFKRSMYRVLTRIFKHDPSWQPPLEKAMSKAGLK